MEIRNFITFKNEKILTKYDLYKVLSFIVGFCVTGNILLDSVLLIRQNLLLSMKNQYLTKITNTIQNNSHLIILMTS